MPKGARGSRGKSRGNPTRVRLGLEVISAPKGITKEAFRRVLINSTYDPQHKLPKSFVVRIRWSNDGGKTVKSDEWENALNDSSTYSTGWDKLMREFLMRSL